MEQAYPDANCNQWRDKKKFVVLAKGSRGDVQPAVALVCALRRALSGTKSYDKYEGLHDTLAPTIVLVTEAFARPLFDELLAKHEIDLVTYKDNRKQQMNGQTSILGSAGASTTTPPGAKAVQMLRAIHEYQVALDACGPGTTCVVFSLFSLEGYSIAEHLGCATICYSP
jgi:hypothetical protein